MYNTMQGYAAHERAASMENLTGRTIKGYELHERIGVGGFGAVYRAYQSLIKRDVAMKIVLPEYADHPEFIRRFEFEAQIVARLEHIHIVPLYDYWREPGGAYLIMRWLRGGSLRGLLKDGALDIAQAVRIAEQVGAALASAHRRGVVHRDIKPDNVLFDEDGNAYLADFGIAKDLSDSDFEETEGNVLTGSPLYLSPEQAQNEEITPQSDIYSFGIVIYEMLTGTPPFTPAGGSLMSVILKHINDPLPPMLELRPELPEPVEGVLARATAKQPGDRYPDADALIAALRVAALGSLESAAPITQKGEGAGVTEPASEFATEIITAPLPAIKPPDVDNPYKGLKPFEEADAADFFGRDELIETLLARLSEDKALGRFLAVIGPSGSGKSSVVKAGLIPAVRRGALEGSDQWYLAEMVPGAEPFVELERALLSVAVEEREDILTRLRASDRGLVETVSDILPGEDSELFLTIDQFEEVFTQVTDEEARTDFLNAILVAVTAPESRIRIVITFRADFYDRPLMYPGFGELIRKRNEVVLPLDREGMREAIVWPASRAGLEVEEALVAAMIAELSDQPSALPLMQYALTEVFERRKVSEEAKGLLTLDAYHASGGILGALARRAEDIYRAMSADAQEAMRQIFLRLASSEEEGTRRRATQPELMALADEDVISEVLDVLGRYRLLTFDHDPVTRVPTVDVAHEALIREWDRLREWLEESREDMQIQRRLSTAAQEWQNQRRDSSFLAVGSRLEQFEGLVERGNVALTDAERGYVEASVAEREAREAEEAARIAYEEELERRSRNRLRVLAVVGIVAAVITSVLAILAFVNFQNAEEQRQIAEANESEAIAQREIAEEQREFAEDARQDAERSAELSYSYALSAQAQRLLPQNDTETALALALESVNIADPPQDSIMMLAQVAEQPGARRVYEGHQGGVNAAVFLPDGERFLSASNDGTLILWERESGDIIRRFEGHEDSVYDVALSPDGTRAVSCDNAGKLIIWDIETGEAVRTLEGHTDRVNAVDWSSDGLHVISASDDGTLILWNVETGEALRTLEGHTNWVLDVAFDPIGRRAVSGSADTTLILWDMRTGRAVRKFEGHTDFVTAVAFAPDGRGVLSGSADTTLRLWPMMAGDADVRIFGGELVKDSHSSWVQAVAFASDGRLIVSAGDDGMILIWTLFDAQPVQRFSGHANYISNIDVSLNSPYILSASGDGTVRLWDLENGALITRFEPHSAQVYGVAVSPDGKLAFTGSFDGSARLWDMDAGRILDTYLADNMVTRIDFDGAGRFAVIGAGDKPVIWDVEAGEVTTIFEGHDEGAFVISAAIDSAGERAITGDVTGNAHVWDVATGEILLTLQHEAGIYGVDFGGGWIITCDAVGMINLWDTETGEPVRTFEQAHTGAVLSVSFAPDAKTAVSSSQDTTVILWDVETGQPLWQYTGITVPIQQAVFNPEGTRIAAASEGAFAAILDAETGARLRAIYTRPIWSVAFIPGAEQIVAGAVDGSVSLWHAQPTELESLTDWVFENRYVPTLSCEERERYHVEPPCEDVES